MLEKVFKDVYQKFKLNFYLGVFARVKERDMSLSMAEAFSVEVIYSLDKPTISEFAQCIQISQPNATYKVNALIKKGYIEKVPSEKDKREYHLKVTDKFVNYNSINDSYIDMVMKRIKKRFPDEDVAKFEEMLGIISSELMSKDK